MAVSNSFKSSYFDLEGRVRELFREGKRDAYEVLWLLQTIVDQKQLVRFLYGDRVFVAALPALNITSKYENWVADESIPGFTQATEVVFVSVLKSGASYLCDARSGIAAKKAIEPIKDRVLSEQHAVWLKERAPMLPANLRGYRLAFPGLPWITNHVTGCRSELSDLYVACLEWWKRDDGCYHWKLQHYNLTVILSDYERTLIAMAK